MTEPVIRMIKCRAAESFFWGDPENPKSRSGGMTCLYITQKRLIVAPLKRSWFWIILCGILIGDWWSFKKAEKRINLPPDNLLDLDKDNYQILNDEVTRVRVDRGTKSKWKPSNAYISFHTKQNSHKFWLHVGYEHKNVDSIIEDLHKNFTDRLIIS